MTTAPHAGHRATPATLPPRLQLRWLRWGLACAALALLGACASKPSTRPGRDGPDARPPTGLEQVPNAEPRIEALRSGGPNKPYEMLGQRYVPMTGDLPLQENGLASWYGRKFHGLPTSSGEPYDMYAMTAAHKTMPIPSYARVRNPANGREVIVRINDRGPFSAGRVIDLSYTAALKLGVLHGVSPVVVQRLTFDDIRAGNWAANPVASQPMTPTPLPLPVPAPVALPVLVNPAPTVAAPGPVFDDPMPGDDLTAAAGFWLQLAAYRQRDNALQLQQRALDSAALPGVAVFEEAGVFRVQAGPFASRADAEAASDRLRRSGVVSGGGVPLVVERPARQR